MSDRFRTAGGRNRSHAHLSSLICLIYKKRERINRFLLFLNAKREFNERDVRDQSAWKWYKNETSLRKQLDGEIRVSSFKTP